MKNFPAWRTIADSIPGIFVIETLAAAAMLLILFGPHVRHWGVFALYSSAFGALLTLIIKLQNRRTLRSLGLSHAKELYALKEAVKTSTPPDDPKLLQALPDYLLRQEKFVHKFRKDFKKNLLMYSVLLLVSLGGHKLWGALFAGMIGFSTYYYRTLDSKLEKLQHYCVVLENDGILIRSQMDTLRKAENKKQHQEEGSWVLPS